MLYLNAPARGHFRASFAVSDAATGASSVLRLFLIGVGGILLRTADVKASKGAAQAVNFDVSGGMTLALTFPTPTDSYVYGVGLSGAARALVTTPLIGGGLPVGGTPVPAGAVHLDCNARPSTQVSAVSALAITATGSLQMEGCGKITVAIRWRCAGAGAALRGERHLRV